MKILCTKNTTTLVKGAIYDVVRMKNAPNANGGFSRSYVSVELPNGRICNASTQTFSNVDGSPLDKKDWSRSVNLSNTYISDVRILKRGDVVIGRTRNLKSLEFGKMYMIEDVLYKEEVKAYSSGLRTYKVITQRIKLQGYGNRWLSTNNFRHCTLQEKREVSLGSVFGTEIPIVRDFKERKIDKLDKSSKEKLITSLLMNTMLNGARNNLNTIDWTLQRNGKFYDLKLDDVSPLLDKKLSEIIKMFD